MRVHVLVDLVDQRLDLELVTREVGLPLRGIRLALDRPPPRPFSCHAPNGGGTVDRGVVVGRQEPLASASVALRCATVASVAIAASLSVCARSASSTVALVIRHGPPCSLVHLKGQLCRRQPRRPPPPPPCRRPGRRRRAGPSTRTRLLAGRCCATSASRSSRRAGLRPVTGGALSRISWSRVHPGSVPWVTRTPCVRSGPKCPTAGPGDPARCRTSGRLRLRPRPAATSSRLTSASRCSSVGVAGRIVAAGAGPVQSGLAGTDLALSTG